MQELKFNVPKWQTRSCLLLGEKKLNLLREKKVLIVGLGGVGAYAAEMICRAGVGKMTIIDGDYIEETNRNRQLPALIKTEGHSKAEVMQERLLQINPELDLTAKHLFIKDQLTDQLLEEKFDYVIDAIDSLSPKLNLVMKAFKKGYPVISSMGAGGKTDPTKVSINDISKSYNCKLAKALRKRLHRFGIRKGIKVVFSPEDIDKNAVFAYEDPETGISGSCVGTISYMPAIFGCCCASVVIKNLLKED